METMETINKDRKEQTNKETNVLKSIININSYVPVPDRHIYDEQIQALRRMVQDREVEETYGLTRDEVTHYDIFITEIGRELHLLWILEEQDLSEQETITLKKMIKERQDKMELFNDMMGL